MTPYSVWKRLHRLTWHGFFLLQLSRDVPGFVDSVLEVLK